MAMTPEIEKILVDYVQEGRKDRIGLQDSFEMMRHSIDRIFNQMQLHEQKDDARFEEIKDLSRGISSRVNRLEDAQEITGRHNMESMRVKLKEEKEAKTWWGRFVIQTLIAVTIAMAGAMISLLVSYALKH